jgi:hypothetical protein
MRELNLRRAKGEACDAYCGFGWNEPWRVPLVSVVHAYTLVSIEVLVYSLRQNRLVCGGQITPTEPMSVEGLVFTTARRVTKEFEQQKLLLAARSSFR